MSRILPRVRLALESDYLSYGTDSPPQIFHDCVVVRNPKLKVQVTFYDQDPEKYPEEAPSFTRDILISAKEPVTFSPFWPVSQKDVGDTWCLGVSGIKAVEYMRIRIMDA